MARHEGRLELTWTNKDKALLSESDGVYKYQFVDRHDWRVSEVRLPSEVARYEAATGEGRPYTLPEPTTDNVLFLGDSMHVLDILNKMPEYAEKYVGKVKLVYIDPPFNTGQAFLNGYEDSIEHSVWLTMLRDRLRQIVPLLSDDGSVWIHLDDAEVHRCRAVMDEELGIENFVATVVWEKADSPNNSAKYLSVDQDQILVYAKNKKNFVAHRLPRSAASDAIYANPDNDPRGRWYPGDPFANKKYSLGLYEVTGPTGRTFKPPPGRFWRISEQKFKELDADGRIWWGPDGNARPSIKRFLDEVGGLTPRTLWRHADVGSNRTSKNEMRALFPGKPSFATPKPERLIRRVLEIATLPGDIVLDCFAGSGTTAAVAHKMGRRWVTSELLSENLEEYTLPRLLKVIRGEDPGGITSEKQRVAPEDHELPEGMTPDEARLFQTLLNKVVTDSDGEIDAAAVRALKTLTKTTEQKTDLWHGGGAFRHVVVGPSMFEDIEGMTMLAEWVTSGGLTEAMCAQLGVRHEPDGIFAARQGAVRYVILDGLVVPATVEAIVDQLPMDELVEIWATQVDPDSFEVLRKHRPGSRLEAIPASVLAAYRKQAAADSPFSTKEGSQ